MNIGLHQTKNVEAILSNDTLTQPKVLIIEDSKFDCVLIRKLLEDYYPMTLVDHATTRFEGLQHLRSNTYDVIILDLNLPDTISFEDIKEFRLLALYTPLIIATGHFDDKAQTAAKENGADGIISKDQLMDKGFSRAVKDAVDNIIML